MIGRTTTGTFALLTALAITIAGAQAFDDAKYPNLKGQWTRAPVPGSSGQPTYDPSKPGGRGQQAPLTPEYQAIFEANLADQKAGGFGTTQGWRCKAWGMPAMMNVYQPMEIVVLPDTSSPAGAAGRRSSSPPIRAECRSASGSTRTATAATTCSKSRPAASRVPASTIPAAFPCITTTRASSPSACISTTNILHDEITVKDNALTRPWTVTKSYRRSPNPRVSWPEYVCADGQGHVEIADQNYYLSGDGLLMPAKKGQSPPDLRYFKQTQK
jgi:hypothetical protein